jgi:hypothetical protein
VGVAGVGEQALEGGFQGALVADFKFLKGLEGGVIRLDGLVRGFDDSAGRHGGTVSVTGVGLEGIVRD